MACSYVICYEANEDRNVRDNNNMCDKKKCVGREMRKCSGCCEVLEERAALLKHRGVVIPPPESVVVTPQKRR